MKIADLYRQVIAQPRERWPAVVSFGCPVHLSRADYAEVTAEIEEACLEAKRPFLYGELPDGTVGPLFLNCVLVAKDD